MIDNREIIDFIELVVKTIQHDFTNTNDCRKELESLLNIADDLSEKLGNGKIVVRERRTVLNMLTGTNRLRNIQ